MKVVAITNARRCELVDRPMPRAGGNYAVVKILAAPMCTEVDDYKAGRLTDMLGHEAAGEVVEVAGPGRSAVGDRVVVMPQNGCGQCEWCLAGDHIYCQHPQDPASFCGSGGRATFSEYCIQQETLLLPIPDDIRTDHASLACCGLGPTFNAMQRMNVNALDVVLVAGLGAVGLGAVVNARVRGARVLGLESHPWRAALALKLGAEAVVDPSSTDAVAQIMELTGGRGADKSLECSSSQSGPGLLVEATRIQGEITSVGWGGNIVAADITRKGLTIRGAWHWNHLRDSHAMFETIRRAGSMLDKFITHRFPLSEVQKAWEVQMTGECGKIILHPAETY